MRYLIILTLICLGCAGRTPIDRTEVLNRSLVKKATALSKFEKYSGIEDEQSSIKEAVGLTTRDIGLVKDCLKHRGGIQNPICRADRTETQGRVTWILASANRGMADVDKDQTANAKTKRKARKTFSAIQAKAQKTATILEQGGLLVTRHNTVPFPQHPTLTRTPQEPDYVSPPCHNLATVDGGAVCLDSRVK